MDLQHGSVVVLAGPTSPLSEAIAAELGRRGACVVLGGERRACDALAADLKRSGWSAISAPTQWMAPEELSRLAETALSRCLRLDAWINCATLDVRGSFVATPLAQHDSIVHETLLFGLHGTYVALRHFLKQGAGTIVNLTLEARRSPHVSATRIASSHASRCLDGMVRKELRREGAGGIHICTVLADVLPNPGPAALAARAIGQLLDHPRALTVINAKGHHRAWPLRRGGGAVAASEAPAASKAQRRVRSKLAGRRTRDR